MCSFGFERKFIYTPLWNVQGNQARIARMPYSGASLIMSLDDHREDEGSGEVESEYLKE